MPVAMRVMATANANARWMPSNRPISSATSLARGRSTSSGADCPARDRRPGADCEEGIDSTFFLQPVAETFVSNEQTEQQEAATEEKQIQHGILSGTRHIEGPPVV
jgi:hypothetical protein